MALPRSQSRLTRRNVLKASALAAVGALVPTRGAASSVNRETLLDDLERRACRYFWEHSNPETGLVLDRAPADGSRGPGRVASIAATGFGLSAHCIADSRGFLETANARARVERSLTWLARRAEHKNGFLYHFVDATTGERSFRSEVSSIDTAWLLCGVIHARQHFASSSMDRLAAETLNRVDWRWMLAGGDTLSHGWTPERGFLPYRWDQYSELMAMYLLAIGASESPIPTSSWHAWKRPKSPEGGNAYIESVAPLFVHQYSHAWLDFRNRRDDYADYFENSRVATLRHRSFCLSMRERFPWIDERMWGITASDSRHGYIDWGGPGTAANAKIDGTLVPCAAGGSLAFLPGECTTVLESMLDRYGNRVWNRYGFVDAFNPKLDWWCPDVIGIDLGIMLLMAENMRTQSVWTRTMMAPEVRRAFNLVGFQA
jgi:hypothetical protein